MLRSSFFRYVNSTQILDISHCLLHQIELGTFSYMDHLSSLNISHNGNLTFRVLSNVTQDLQYSQIQTLDISKIHCMHGPGTVIYTKDIIFLRNTRLQYLYIDDNRLSTFGRYVCGSLPRSLKFMSIRHNRLTFDCYVFYFSKLSIKIIDMSHQYQGFLSDEQFNEVDCNDWRAPPNLTQRKCGPQNKKLRPLILPSNLTHLYANDLRIINRLDGLSFDGLQNITHIELQHNVLYEWKGQLNLTKLTYLDLSDNFCASVSPNLFSKCINMRTLLIQNNILGPVFAKDFNGILFKNLAKLETLNISFNRIYTIPANFLKSQRELKSLNLSNNNLLALNFPIAHMKSLSDLDLSNNQLRAIDKEQRDQIDALKTNKFTINLAGNMLQCACDTVDFFEWMQANKDRFKIFKSYSCIFPDGNNMTFEHFDNILTDLNKACASYTGIIIFSTIFIVLAITFATSGIVYRYRWKLRYLFYMAKTKHSNRNGYSTVQDNNDVDGVYEYDAFVSYSAKDDHFVRHDILDNLERHGGLRLCLHQRDFMPGKDIAENIISAIHCSRKTVLILSKHYLRSYWCMFEFNMAKMESLYSRGGNSILLIVFYENIALRKLPLTIMDIIESKSYIEYPNDEQGNVVFWQKLADTILH